MPIIIAHILEGRRTEQIALLAKKLTEAAVEALDAPPDTVRVLVQELPKTHYAIAGITAAERQR